jgi:hypothetical protein
VARGATTLTRVAVLSCAWWTAGAGVLTFHAPFKATSNGYFASWGALSASLVLFSVGYHTATGATAAATATAAAAAAADADAAARPLAGLLACSVVLLVASGFELESQATGGIAIWALITAACTSVPVALLLLSPSRLSGRSRTLLFVVMVVAWASVVYFATIVGPFAGTGNGYFSAWGGLICATLVLAQEGSGQPGALPSARQLATEARVLLRCVGIASLVLLLHTQGFAAGGTPRNTYALAAAGVSLVLVTALALHGLLRPTDAADFLGTRVCSCALKGGKGAWSVESCVALFLSAWWATAAAVLTFFGPFVGTSNPYFATWAALLFSLLLLASTKRGGSS